jgi:hypothetical protein
MTMLKPSLAFRQWPHTELAVGLGWLLAGFSRGCVAHRATIAAVEAHTIANSAIQLQTDIPSSVLVNVRDYAGARYSSACHAARRPVSSPPLPNPCHMPNTILNSIL